jgi:hypothetical protein
MKQALISPNEIIEFEGNNIGVRVAQVVFEGETFPVGDPLFWVECADNVNATNYYYDLENGLINPIPYVPDPRDNIERVAPEEVINVTQTIS